MPVGMVPEDDVIIFEAAAKYLRVLTANLEYLAVSRLYAHLFKAM